MGSAPLALGSLEMLWEHCYESGDDFLGDATDVETVAQWAGAPGALVEALVTAGGGSGAGFLEPDADKAGCYRVHDLYDHAPEYVRKRMDREAARKDAGITLKQLRADAAGKRWKRQNSDANGSHLQPLAIQTEASGTTPAPAPSPHPAQPSPEKNAPGAAEQPAAPPVPVVPVVPLADLEADWPPDLIKRVREAVTSTRRGGTMAEGPWRAFLLSARQFGKAQREAAANEYLDRALAPTGKDERYLLGMIRNGAGPAQPQLPGRGGVYVPLTGTAARFKDLDDGDPLGMHLKPKEQRP
jgi:hypothetical protein